MAFLLDLGDGLRSILRARGLTVVASTAAASDKTLTLATRLVNAPDDADGEGRNGSTGGGACDVAVTVIYRSDLGGDVRWLGSASDTVQAALATLRQTTVNGVGVSWVRFDYGADLGTGDRGRPEASDNFMVRAVRPVLV